MSKKKFDEPLNRYLYRGIGGDVADNLILKALTPKEHGEFLYIFKSDGVLRLDGSATLGKSLKNAILRHQLNQEGYPTSGISTTPHKDRARIYALGKDRCHNQGIILKIDRYVLSRYGVSEAVVSDTVLSPSVPEDDEVVLFDNSDRALPCQIVVKIETVIAE